MNAWKEEQRHIATSLCLENNRRKSAYIAFLSNLKASLRCCWSELVMPWFLLPQYMEVWSGTSHQYCSSDIPFVIKLIIFCKESSPSTLACRNRFMEIDCSCSNLLLNQIKTCLLLASSCTRSLYRWTVDTFHPGWFYKYLSTPLCILSTAT